jgi:hypothetical protein
MACNEELGVAEDCSIQRLEVASDCLIVVKNIIEIDNQMILYNI